MPIDPKQHKIIVLAGLAAVALFFAVFRAINRSVENRINVQVREEKTSPKVPAPAAPSQPQTARKRLLNPGDHGQYHITAQPQSILLQNQRQWDSATQKTLRQSDVISRMSEGGAFKGIEKTPAQFQKQLQRIDGRIREYERKVQNTPGDDDARRKLRDLYMLRSTLSGLEGAVVEK